MRVGIKKLKSEALICFSVKQASTPDKVDTANKYTAQMYFDDVEYK